MRVCVCCSHGMSEDIRLNRYWVWWDVRGPSVHWYNTRGKKQLAAMPLTKHPLLRQRWGMKEHRNLFKNVAAFSLCTLIFRCRCNSRSIFSAEKWLSLQCCFSWIHYIRIGCGFSVPYYSEKHLSFGQTNVCDRINFCSDSVVVYAGCVFSIFPHLTIAKLNISFISRQEDTHSLNPRRVHCASVHWNCCCLYSEHAAFGFSFWPSFHFAPCFGRS